MIKIVKKSQGEIPKFSVVIDQKSIPRRYCIQNFKDKSQIRVYKINKERFTHFSQFISIEVAKIFKSVRLNFWKS